MDLSGVDGVLHLLVEPSRLTVYGVRDELVMDWRSDDGEPWTQRVIWEHDTGIETASATPGVAGRPVVTLAINGGAAAPTTGLSTDDGGRNWRLVHLDAGSQLLAANADTLLVRPAATGEADGGQTDLLNRIALDSP